MSFQSESAAQAADTSLSRFAALTESNCTVEVRARINAGLFKLASETQAAAHDLHDDNAAFTVTLRLEDQKQLLGFVGRMRDHCAAHETIEYTTLNWKIANEMDDLYDAVAALSEQAPKAE